MDVRMPDGVILRGIPEGTPKDEIMRKYSARSGQAQPSAPDAFAGDDLLSNDAMQKLSAGAQSTVTPTQDRSGIAKYLSSIRSAFTEPVQQTSVDKIPLVGQLAGIGEAGLSMATGMFDPITAPLFAGGEVGGGTYQPRTGSGKALMNVMGAVTAPVAESGNALLPLAPELQSLSLRRIPKAPTEAPKPIPTTEALKKAKNEAYALAKEADVSVPAADYSTALGKIRNVVTDEGIDPTLHPKSTAVMRRLDAAEGQPLSLQQAETLRKIALDAEDDLNPVTRAPTPDARIAGKIVDELDDQIDALSLNSEARALNARYRRSDMIDRMIKRAEIRAGANYTQAGMEHALRQEFKTLALNDRRMRFFTPTQREAIEKVAKGGAMENSLRAIGKFDPTTGGMAAFMGGTLGTLAGGPMGLAIPAAGFVGKRLATRMTAGNVAKAREALVGRGLQEPAAPTIAQPVTPAMQGELMRRPPLALPAPSIIAGSRSAPGTAYAREQIGLTPDIERAGALHPAMARESLIPRKSTTPQQPALPYRQAPGLLSDNRPMVVDSQGRVARIREELQQYLRDSGQERMRNVRQPNVGPMPERRGLLADEPIADVRQGLLSSTRSADQIRADLKKLDAKMQRLPDDEPLDSPKMKAIEADWARLRAELSAAESATGSP